MCATSLFTGVSLLLYVFRVADKEKFENIISRYETEAQTLMSKVAVAQSNKRFREQVGRDESNGVGAVSIYEYEELQKDMRTLREDMAKVESEGRDKDLSISALSGELTSAQLDLQTAQEVRAKLQKANSELSKKESHFAERLAEAVQQQEERNASLELDLEKLLGELRTKQREMDASKEELGEVREEAEKSVADLRRMKGEVHQALKAVEQANERGEEIQTRCQELEAEVVTLNNKLSLKQTALDEAVRAGEREVDGALEVETGLREELEDAKEAERKALKVVQELEGKCDGLVRALAVSKRTQNEALEEKNKKPREDAGEDVGNPSARSSLAVSPSSEEGGGNIDALREQRSVIASLNKTVASLQEELKLQSSGITRDLSLIHI